MLEFGLVLTYHSRPFRAQTTESVGADALPRAVSVEQHIAGRLTMRMQNMYAVIESGGKQHRVEEGETLKLEKLEVATGETVEFDRV